MQSISATKAREKFSEILSKVAYTNHVFVIERQGVPLAKLVKVDQSEKPNEMKINSAKGFFEKIKKQNGFTKGPKDLVVKLDTYLYNG
ncbi:MAG: hypothetical protein A2770_02655 [Candidatus Levybacteria bacterium RIFCSPHIGHO2_01_FULL_38_12]|nr:MAG: hypothetical protein A2770_02655 [Candidatus Levybacteria bacterium RIFCSPHIGHO2_01_FULL_38_12]